MEFFAHRGGSVETLGNTVSAVMRSLAMGLNIEIDVTPCKDALICTHSERIGSDMITSFGLDGVRKYRLDSTGFKLDVFPVEGSHAERVPTLLEVLTLVKRAGNTVRVLLDLKSGAIAQEVRDQVKWLGMEGQVLYGIHRANELPDWQGHRPVLAFCGRDELETFCESDVPWIRLWQDWVRDDHGQLTDPDGLIGLVQASNKQLCAMTGGPNLADGGVCSLAEIRQLHRMGFNAAILNDPSLCLQGAYEIAK